MIDIHFFGRGAGFNPVEGNTNAWFAKGKNLVMLDCGESTFAAAARHPGLADWESITVLLTHLHADHSGSLASFCAYNYIMLHRRVLIVHPVDTVKYLLRIQGVAEEVYRWEQTLPEGLGFRATAKPVRHAPDMACFAYDLSDEDETIYYSGDAAEFADEAAARLLDGTYRRVYHDVASYPSDSHCPLSELERKVPAAYRHKVYAMHLDSDFESTLREKGFRVVQTAHPDET